MRKPPFLMIVAFVMVLVAACDRGDDAAPDPLPSLDGVVDTTTTAAPDEPAVATTAAAETPAEPAGDVEQAAIPGRILIQTVGGDLAYTDATRGLVEVAIPEAQNAGVTQPTWAPDGERFSFATLDASGAPIAVIMDAATQETTTAPTPFVPFYFYWSDDGSQLAFLGSGTTGVELGIVDARTGDVRQAEGGPTYYFAWAPESDRLMAVIGNQAARLVGLDGDTEPLTFTPAQFNAPAWTADGSRIVYGQLVEEGDTSASGPGTQVALQAQQQVQELVVADVTTGSSEALTEYAGSAAFEISPDDSAVAVTANGGMPPDGFHLSIFPLDGSAQIPVSQDLVLAAEWSPDGEKLLFLTVSAEARTFTWNVWSAGERTEFDAAPPSAFFVSAILPFWDQYTRSATLWAPDSSAFVYAATVDEVDTILIQSLDADAPEALAPGLLAWWSPS